jgi:UDP-4-amino-4,6-dideoxy-N-acetyl-beta-L-altrosamine transaminase
MIPYARPDVNDDDIQAVSAILKSDWLTQGPAQEKFEAAMAAYCGVKYAVSVSSATAGLHLIYLALGLRSGEQLWTSSNTFVATANCARYCGALADFIDIDPCTYNLCPNLLAAKLTVTKRKGKKLPKIIVPVHFAGQSCLMEEIATTARAEGIAIVEDAAHAVGATYRDRPVGCCEWSDAAVFSFHAVKIMTTGEGGMILTNRSDLYEKLIRLRTHGITRDERFMSQASHGPWYYEQVELGYQYRMTDFQAALGTSQLRRLNAMVMRRREISRIYQETLKNLPLHLPRQHSDTQSSWHLYVIRLKLPELKKTHRQVFEALREAGIGVNLHYIPVHMQPDYQRLGFQSGDFPEAERYYAEAITLPIYSKLSEAEQGKVISALQKVILEV